jgi:hypothetical protein
MLIVITKNAFTEHVNHHLIQNLERKDIIKTATASQIEGRGEERWPRKAYI